MEDDGNGGRPNDCQFLYETIDLEKQRSAVSSSMQIEAEDELTFNQGDCDDQDNQGEKDDDEMSWGEPEGQMQEVSHMMDRLEIGQGLEQQAHRGF